jgi:gas vesicle protein
MEDLVGRLLRELPDTDKDRYDIAYARGRAQARSSLLLGGLALGLALGAAAMSLLDPTVGRSRRAEVRQRLGGMTNQLRQSLEAGRGEISKRASGAAPDRGLPATQTSSAHHDSATTIAVRTRPDLTTAPRSSVAPSAAWTSADDRERVGASVDR